jgi:4-hydroxy 2-oxovalerate aldolase
MKINNITILDCTMRDGSYYNKWDFDRGTVDRYLTAFKASFIDVVELEYLSLQHHS